LASEFGISRERVRQIEVRAFQKVQRAVKNRVANSIRKVLLNQWALFHPSGCTTAHGN